jgi:hypothetical protein
MNFDNVFPAVPEEFHERIENTLNALETGTIKSIKQERVKNMTLEKQNKHGRSLFITLGAAAAAIMLVVVGGSFLLNGEAPLREPAPLSGGEININLDDITEANLIASMAKNVISDFFQNELQQGEGIPADMKGVIAVARNAQGEILIAGRDNYGGSDIIDAVLIVEDGKDLRFLTAIQGLFEDYEPFQAFADKDSTLVFIIADNDCTHAAFIPGISDTYALNLTVTTENDEITFKSVINSTLVDNFSEKLQRGQLIGLAPYQDYPRIDEQLTIDSELQTEQVFEDVICEDEVYYIALNRAIEAAAAELPRETYFSTAITSIELKSAGSYVAEGFVYTLEENSASTQPVDGRAPLDIDDDALVMAFEVTIDAYTGDIIMFQVF